MEKLDDCSGSSCSLMISVPAPPAAAAAADDDDDDDDDDEHW